MGKAQAPQLEAVSRRFNHSKEGDNEPYKSEHFGLQRLHWVTGVYPCIFPYSSFESAWFAQCTRLLDPYNWYVVGGIIYILRVRSIHKLDILHEAHRYYESDDPSIFSGSSCNKQGATPDIGTWGCRFAIRQLDIHCLESGSVVNEIPRRLTMRWSPGRTPGFSTDRGIS